MATVGTVSVNLFANGVASFMSKFGAAGRAVQTFGAQARSVTTSVAGKLGIGGLIGGVSVGAAAAGFKELAVQIDSTADLSQRLGVTTENLTKLRHAAKLSGSSAEEFDNALEKMTRILGDAAIAGGPAAKTLESLGLSAKALANQTPDEAFRTIAEAISQIPSPAQRAAVAVDLFGKSGQKLLNTLMLGKKGLAEAGADAERFGTVLSNIDAAKVQAANDEVDRLGELFKGIKTRIAVEVSPFVEALAKKFIDSATEGESMGTKVHAAFETMAQGAVVVANAVDAIEFAFRKTQIAATGFLSGVLKALPVVIDEAAAAATGGLGRGLGRLLPQDFLDTYAEDLERLAERQKEAMDKWLADSSRGERIKKLLDEIKAAAQTAAEAAAKNAGEAGKIDEALARAAEQAKALKAMQQDAKRIFEETRTPLEKATAEMEKLNKLWEAGLVDADTYGRKVDMINKSLERSEKTLEAINSQGAVTRGSQGEFSLLSRARFGVPAAAPPVFGRTPPIVGGDGAAALGAAIGGVAGLARVDRPINETANNTEKIKQETNRQGQTLRDILRASQEVAKPVIVEF